MFLLSNSLFFQNASLAKAILVLISSVHFASSEIQLPKYLYRDTCSRVLLSNVTWHFILPLLLTTITLVFYIYGHPITCSFCFKYAAKTASSAYLTFVILILLNCTPF